MGNSPLTSLRLSNRDHSISYHVQLGESAAIDFTGREVKQKANGEITESWQMSYTAGKSTCNLALTKTKGNTNSPPHGERIDVKITDAGYEESKNRYNSVTVQRAQAGLLHPSSWTWTNWNWNPKMDPHAASISLTVSYNTMRNLTTGTTTAHGGVTETKFDLYGSGRRRGLMVCEWKRESEDKDPFMGTVAHYYANAENGNDVGLSLAIKRIRVSDDGHLDFAVDGPRQHPVNALFYMFDEVNRTGTWKTTYCPHCANNIIQRQLASFGQSTSEDSDKDNNVPEAQLHSRRPNAGGIVANDGVFKGNNNGNLNIRKLILRLRGR